jgi:hypothetical protein
VQTMRRHSHAEATPTANLTRGDVALIADRRSVTSRKRIFDPEFSNGCVWIEVYIYLLESTIPVLERTLKSLLFISLPRKLCLIKKFPSYFHGTFRYPW